MTTARTAVLSTAACVCLWAAKAVAIDLAGGLGRSPAEGPLFLLGLLASVVGAVALAVSATAGRGTGVRIGLGVLLLVALAIPATLVQYVVVAARPARPGWLWGELDLWALALTLVVGVVLLVAGRGPRRGTAGVRGPGTAASDSR